jgi:hypothetical protein
VLIIRSLFGITCVSSLFEGKYFLPDASGSDSDYFIKKSGMKYLFSSVKMTADQIHPFYPEYAI